MDKDRIKGTVEQAKGAVKEGVGKAAGDPKLEVEGRNEKAAGKVPAQVLRFGSRGVGSVIKETFRSLPRCFVPAFAGAG